MNTGREFFSSIPDYEWYPDGLSQSLCPEDCLAVLNVLNSPPSYKRGIYDKLVNIHIEPGSETQTMLDRIISCWVAMTNHFERLNKEKRINLRHSAHGDVISATLQTPYSNRNPDPVRWRIGGFVPANGPIQGVLPSSVGARLLVGKNSLQVIGGNSSEHDAHSEVFFPDSILLAGGTPVVVKEPGNSILCTVEGGEEDHMLVPVTGMDPYPLQGNESKVFPALAWVNPDQAHGRSQREPGFLQKVRTLFTRRETNPSLQEIPVMQYISAQLQDYGLLPNPKILASL